MAKPLKRQILEQARELLSNPNNWTQGEYQDFDYDENANAIPLQRFCLIGAVRYAAGIDLVNQSVRDLELRGLPPHVKAAEKVLAAVACELDPDLKECMHTREKVTEYNDHDDRTHEEIMAILDKALERI